MRDTGYYCYVANIRKQFVLYRTLKGTFMVVFIYYYIMILSSQTYLTDVQILVTNNLSGY